MIHEISPELDNAYRDVKPSENSVVFHFEGTKVLTRINGKPLPVLADFTLPDELIYLFSTGKTDYFLLRDSIAVVPDSEYTEASDFRRKPEASPVDKFALATALHLSEWYSSSRYCGRCGGKTVPDSKERAVKCTFCGKIIYPRINPAVIVGVTDGDRLLVTRYAGNRGVAHESLIAGFTEIGETLEETVRREVAEEVGISVKNIRYYKSQPWGYSGCILAGFFCEADGNTDLSPDKSELSSAEWVRREDISGQPDDLSLTHDMMMYFKKDSCQ